MLSGIVEWKKNSIENILGLKSLGGMSLDAKLAKRSALAFWSLGIKEIQTLWNVKWEIEQGIDNALGD